MLRELGHKGLAEFHDFVIAFALRVEVGAAFAAAHGQAGQAVFEDLLEAEEFDDRLVDRGVQAQAALVGADGGVKLDAPAAVDLDVAVVVDPGDAEVEDAFGFDDAFHDAVFFNFGAGFHDGLEGLEDFADGLKEFGFVGVALGEPFVNAVQVSVFQRHID